MYDLDHNVEFNGVYQSMTKQAAITVQVRLIFILFYFFVPVMFFSTLSCVSLVLSPFFFFLKGFYLDSKTLLMFG